MVLSESLGTDPAKTTQLTKMAGSVLPMTRRGGFWMRLPLRLSWPSRSSKNPWSRTSKAISFRDSGNVGIWILQTSINFTDR